MAVFGPSLSSVREWKTSAPMSSMIRIPFAAVVVTAVVTALIAIAAPAAVSAQGAPAQVGVYRDWAVFTVTENGQRVCFMASQPQRSQPNNLRRGDIYVTVTHRPADRILDEVSFVAGYPFRPGSEVQVQIGNDRFVLFTEGEAAWARDAETDRRLSEAIRRGSSMVVRGTSARNNTTTDTFSLSGTGQAYQEMNRACNVRR